MLDTATNRDTLLAVNNIEVIYNHVILVLKGVSLTVPRGGIVAILGANGAGKTTTLKAISNLLRSERGEVTKGTISFKGDDGGPTEMGVNTGDIWEYRTYIAGGTQWRAIWDFENIDEVGIRRGNGLRLENLIANRAEGELFWVQVISSVN